MRSVTNYFLVNLALADIGMATLNCIPNFIYMRDRWAVGSDQPQPSTDTVMKVHCDCINCYKNICSYVAQNCTILTSMDL